MKVIWKLLTKEIRQKFVRFMILVLGMTAAICLITVMTVFSTSCLHAMIQQEKNEKGPYESVFHNLTPVQAEKLMENSNIQQVWKLPSCPENGTVQEGRACYGVSFKRISLSIFERSQEVGDEILMDLLPEEEQRVIFSRTNKSVISRYDITFNEKLLGYYGINVSATTAGSAWAILLIDFVISLFAAVLLYYVVLSGLEEKRKTLGLLDGIGISSRQKKYFAYGETILAGCIAIPLGLILGIGILFASIQYLNKTFLSSYDLKIHVNLLFLLGIVIGSIVLIFISGQGVYERIKNENIINLISGYAEEEEYTRTTVLLSAKKHFFKAETLLAIKNVRMNHKNYYVSSALLVIALCVFLNGIIYVQGMTSVGQTSTVYPHFSLWAEARSEDTLKLEEFREKVKAIPEISQISLIKDTEQYNPLETLKEDEIIEYLKETYQESLIEFYTDYGMDDLNFSLYPIGIDNESFMRFIEDRKPDQTILNNHLPEGVIVETPYSDMLSMKEFPLIIDGKKENVPIVSTIFSLKKHESNVILPSYLLTQQERQEGTFGIPYYLNGIDIKIILYMSMENFDQLMEPYQSDTVHFEIVLKRDKGNTVSLDDILYPDHISQRIQDEQKAINQIKQIAKEAGLENFQIYSFASEYQESFFTGGEGIHLLLIAALVSAVWLAALFIILQKDAATLRKRQKEFALLQSIGMTRKRIIKMIFTEHLLYFFAGTFIGIPLSLFFLSGLYNDGGAPQLTSPWDIPFSLIGGQILITLATVLLPFLYIAKELRKMDMITVIRKED